MTRERNTMNPPNFQRATHLCAALATALLLTACGGGGNSSGSDGGGALGQGQSTTSVAAKALHLAGDTATQSTLTALAGHMGGPGNVDGMGAAARFDAPGSIFRRPDDHFLVADKNNKAIRVVSPQGEVTTLFRNPSGASAEPFALPEGVVYDSTITHRTYVSDRQKHVIYSIGPSGEVQLFAGKEFWAGHSDGAGEAVRFSTPLAMTLGPLGKLFVIDRDNHAVRTVDANGVVGTLTGQGVQGPAVDDVPASEALFNHPVGIAYAKPLRHMVPASHDDYRVFISDTRNHVIRYYSANDGRVRILAGKSGVVGSVDGIGGAARFQRPEGLAVSPRGDYLAVTDTGNHTVRRIYIGPGERFGEVETLAGAPGQEGDGDGAAATARFQQPASLAFDGAGDLLINDFASSTVRKLTLGRSPSVSTLAGLPAQMGALDGPGDVARFRNPSGIALDGERALVADTGNHLIRAVAADGTVTRLAGSGQAGAIDGNAADARFNQPKGVATTAPGGTMYVADAGNATLRAIAPVTGLVSTVAGLAGQIGGGDGALNESRLNKPVALAASQGDTKVYVADLANHNIRALDTTNGRLSTIAGLAGAPVGNADGVGGVARFNKPVGIAAASVDLLYVLDAGNRAVRKLLRQVNGEWIVSTLVTGLNVTDASAIAVDGAGVIHVADTQFVVRRYAPSGEALGVALGTLDQRGFVPGNAPGVIDGARGMAFGDGRLVFTTAQGVGELNAATAGHRESGQ
jgi:DNA-binding beta-propeller fold protein YncE